MLKLILGNEIIDILGTYAPQARLNNQIKRDIREILEEANHCIIKLYLDGI